MKKILYLMLGICATLFVSCSSGSDDSDSDSFDSIVNAKKGADLPPEKLTEILKSIPSPIETSSIILESGAQFHKDFLNPTANLEKYKITYKKALNLGIYGADMGYLNIYEETVTSLSYLETVRGLSSDLKVDQFFDINTIKRLASNKKNADSLIYISTSGFDRMSTYLKNQNRSHISALILVGGWIESLYLSTQIVQSKPSAKLTERIAEQKIPLEKITELIMVYKSDAMFADLVKSIEELNSVYKGIEITYTKGEAEVYVDDKGMLVTKDNSKSEVHITPAQQKQVINVVAKIRNKLIS